MSCVCVGRYDEISRYEGRVLKINLETMPETRTRSSLVISNETAIHISYKKGQTTKQFGLGAY
jgi:hypothetical protein